MSIEMKSRVSFYIVVLLARVNARIQSCPSARVRYPFDTQKLASFANTFCGQVTSCPAVSITSPAGEYMYIF